MPHIQFSLIIKYIYAKHYVNLYGKDLVYRSKSIQTMVTGDILIIPENIACVEIPFGAILFVYQLSTTMVQAR